MSDPAWDGPTEGFGAWDEELEMLPGSFALSDLGNGERLATRYHGELHWSSQRRKFLVWSKSRWAWDETMQVERMAKATVRGIYREASACSDPEDRKATSKWATKSESKERVSAMVTLAKAERGVAVAVGDLDLDPMLLNCENGTLDLATGELRPHNRADLITKSTGLNYRPGAGSMLWDKVLWNATGGDKELASYLQRVAGYALCGKANERKFFFLQGPPGTGKSTIIDALMAALGEYARATSFDTWLQRPNVGGNRPDLVALQGVRLVTSGECRKGAKWDTALIKGITGGDLLNESAKFENPVEFRPVCTIVLAANNAPRANEDDDGFWVRMQRIPFNSIVPLGEQVKDLKDELRKPENAEAVLAWAFEGFRLWNQAEGGGIGSCPVVTESTAQYRETSDDFMEFMAEFFVKDEGAKVTVPAFRCIYKAWQKREDIKFGMRTPDLREKMDRMGFPWKVVNGKRIIEGLRVNADAETSGSEQGGYEGPAW